MPRPADLAFHPLTPGRWPAFEKLFGRNGACGGCWCMWWRQSRPEFQAGKGDANRRALKRLVEDGTVPGVLACAGEEAVGWVAIQPREDYPRLARSRSLAPVDDAAVWSITCFFVAREWRGKGLMRKLLDAAVAHARRNGARAVEGYPVDSTSRLAAVFVYTGVPVVFEDAGFEEVARRARTRPIFRRKLARTR